MMRPSLWIGAEPLELTAIVEAVAREERGPGNSRPPGGLGRPGGSGNSVEASPNEGSNAGADGAVVTFFGLVRNRNAGRSVRYLEYDAYEPLALRAFERIASEI